MRRSSSGVARREIRVAAFGGHDVVRGLRQGPGTPGRGPCPRRGCRSGPCGSGRPRASVTTWRDVRYGRPRAFETKSLSSTTRGIPVARASRDSSMRQGRFVTLAAPSRTGPATPNPAAAGNGLPAQEDLHDRFQAGVRARSDSVRCARASAGPRRFRRSRDWSSFRRCHPRGFASAATLAEVVSPARGFMRTARMWLRVRVPRRTRAFRGQKKAPGRGGAARGAKGGG